MVIMDGWQFQCTITSCLPIANITVSNILNCQVSCLENSQCKAASFRQSTSNCQLFSNDVNQNTTLVGTAGTVTMVVIDGTRTPSASSPPTSSSSPSASTSSPSASTSTSSVSVCNSTYSSSLTFSTGSQPFSAAVIDVNSDSKPDIIAANSGADTVSVFLNKGNGTFSPQTTYSTGTGSQPLSVAVADVNSDSNPDIVTANYATSTVSVLLNNGNGTFSSKTTFTAGSHTYAVAIADVNSDSKPDIITANYGADTVSILLNNGNGTFLPQTTFTTDSSPSAVQIVDVNSDSKPDIITANYDGNTVSVLLNKGNGTFSSQTTYSTATAPDSVAVADVNSDSKPDIVTANHDANTVSVFLNKDNGTFSSQTTYATGTKPYSVALFDVNCDSKADIIAANKDSDTVSILLNKGNGTFSPQITYTTDTGPAFVAVIDRLKETYIKVSISLFVLIGLIYYVVAAPTANEPLQIVTARADTSRSFSVDKHVDKVLSFWTDDKLKAARPVMPNRKLNAQSATKLQPIANGPLGFVDGTIGSLQKAAVEAGIVSGIDQNDPSSRKVFSGTGRHTYTVGKIFWNITADTYGMCSGTIVTAGHCCYDYDAKKWRINQNFIFIPGYNNGAQPYGKWAARAMTAYSSWAVNKNFNYDVCFVNLYTNSKGQHIQALQGSEGLGYNYPRNALTYSFGYPYNLQQGQVMQYCSGKAAASKYGNGFNGQTIPCDMTGGCSGGPWFQSFDTTVGVGTITSLNSFTINSIANYMNGPYFDSSIWSLYQQCATK
ncbi:unnamed protein product [Adineta ricciae]|uniref:Apple domain-containing protein n=1 Tax=Adineta ricciae TaxID=249248 RepID=A0A815ZF65_ADIRI|nr:unnamed protein product [Adineta ricciae]